VVLSAKSTRERHWAEPGTQAAISLFDRLDESSRGETIMMNYMCEGGGIMWLLLITAIATPAIAFTRDKKEQAMVLFVGCVLEIIFGMLGMAIGLEGVSAHYAQWPDKVEALGAGLGELANNGTFATVLSLGLGLGSLIARRRAAATDEHGAATVGLRDARVS